MTVFSQLTVKYKTIPIKKKFKNVLKKPIKSFDTQSFLNYWNIAEKYEWPLQPYYTGTGLHFNKQININPSRQVCGQTIKEYQDTLFFDCAVNQDLLDKIGEFKTVRSKITCVNTDLLDLKSQQSHWHKDETPFEALRIIIPLQTSSEYSIQLDNQQPVCLETGYAYAFDQSIYHRVLVTEKSKINRIHLVLSVVTWFNMHNDEWIPNKYHNKVHPLDIFSDIVI